MRISITYKAFNGITKTNYDMSATMMTTNSHQ